MAEWKLSQGRRPQSAHLRPVPLGATGGTHRPTNLPVYGGGKVRTLKGTRRGIQPSGLAVALPIILLGTLRRLQGCTMQAT